MSRKNLRELTDERTSAVRTVSAAKSNGRGAVTFSNQLLVTMLSFRNGDFSVRLPADLTGLEGKIADAFNDIVAVTERRARETRRVSLSVGKEGKLKQRMSVQDARGGWGDEVAAINMLIDDLVWPTTEVTRAIGAVAKGDLGQAMALFDHGPRRLAAACRASPLDSIRSKRRASPSAIRIYDFSYHRQWLRMAPAAPR